MTGYHNIQHAVKAMRQYSFHYMIKPFRIDQVVSLIERAEREAELVKENKRLELEVSNLREEIEKLKLLLPDEASKRKVATDRASKPTVSDANVLKSYERHQISNQTSNKKK